jgi:hypothetical protein
MRGDKNTNAYFKNTLLLPIRFFLRLLSELGMGDDAKGVMISKLRPHATDDDKIYSIQQRTREECVIRAKSL